ncbi:MAG: hypothetical protein EON93_13980 [Burkholderiales bacterium]|nr:MAG: hypothetical protein EON93_13980 [Burkholderiales bacterium]
MLAAFGVYRVADWVYGGRADLGLLLAGLGFFLMVPAAPFVALRREELPSSPHYKLRLALAWIGLALVIFGTARHWVAP